jgi:hypothetical protein
LLTSFSLLRNLQPSSSEKLELLAVAGHFLAVDFVRGSRKKATWLLLVETAKFYSIKKPFGKFNEYHDIPHHFFSSREPIRL